MKWHAGTGWHSVVGAVSLEGRQRTVVLLGAGSNGATELGLGGL